MQTYDDQQFIFLFRDLIIQFNLEAGYLCHTFYEYKRAQEHFKTATKVAGLNLELTGK
jgi:hypothetical protein